MSKYRLKIIFLHLILITSVFVFSPKTAYAQCGAGYYCSGSQSYLQVTACENRGYVVPPHGCSQEFCYNAGTQTNTVNCTNAGCTASAPGSQGCTSVRVIYRVVGGIGRCVC